MEPVRRPDDGELCGFVASRADGWAALTVFGAELGGHGAREDAIDQVLAEGLPSLASRWTLRNGATGEREVVCIQEANADAVTVARGYYSIPGTPVLTITTAEIVAGEWELTLRR